MPDPGRGPRRRAVGTTANYDPFRRLVKDVEFRIYEGLPHNICDAFPDRCAADVLDFLRTGSVREHARTVCGERLETVGRVCTSRLRRRSGRAAAV